MKNIIFLSSLILFIACKTEKTNKTANLITELDSVSYSLGVNIGENIKTQFENINLDNFEAGIKDVLEKDVEAKISDNQAQAIIQSYFSKKQQKQSESMKEEGANFLKENKTKEGVQITESGLQYLVISEGNGKQPSEISNVTVHYHGTTPSGEVFDSSVDRGEPATFGLNQVIKGWTEGVQLMKEGSKYKFFIPQELAYGANPRPGGPIKPYMPLVFEIELISVND